MGQIEQLEIEIGQFICLIHPKEGNIGGENGT